MLPILRFPDMDQTTFYASLSHTSWGLVAFACVVVLGVAVHWLGRCWRERRGTGNLLALVAAWAAFLWSAWLCLAGLLHVGCAMVKSQQAVCLGNVKKLSQAMLLYAADYDETLPPSDVRWSERLKLDEKETLHCPRVKAGTSYAMNQTLGGRSLARIELPEKTVLLFEAKTPVGGEKDNATRHSGGGIVGYTDGHVRWERTFPRFGGKGVISTP